MILRLRYRNSIEEVTTDQEKTVFAAGAFLSINGNNSYFLLLGADVGDGLLTLG